MADDTAHPGADDVPTNERSIDELMDGMKQAFRDAAEGNVESDLDTIRENVTKLRE